MSKNLEQKCKKFFIDFLPDGKYHNPTEKLKTEAKSCPSNNISMERLMAQLDRQKTIAPNTSNVILNSKLIYTNNRTSDWLQEKDPSEKQQIFSQARKMVETIKEKENEKQISLINERTEIIENRKMEKEKKIKRMDENTQKNKDQLDQLGGKWNNVEHVRNFLTNADLKKEKMSALKCQIKYRKEILKQPVKDKSIFKLSESMETLQKNLESLIILENENEENTENEKANETPSASVDIHVSVPTSQLSISTSTCIASTSNISEITSNYAMTTSNCSAGDSASTSLSSSPSLLLNSNSTPQPSSTLQSSSAAEPSLSDNDQTTTTSPRHGKQLTPPSSYSGKKILHTWDEGDGKLNTYHGQVLYYKKTTKSYRIAYWEPSKGEKINKKNTFELTTEELNADFVDGCLKIID